MELAVDPCPMVGFGSLSVVLKLSVLPSYKGFYLEKVRSVLIQGVPLATEPGISLIILPLMRILQLNLKRTHSVRNATTS